MLCSNAVQEATDLALIGSLIGARCRIHQRFRGHGLESNSVADQQCGPVGLNDQSLFQVGEKSGCGLARSADHLGNLFMSQCQLQTGFRLHRFAVFRTPLKQEPCKSFARGTGQTQRP